VKIIFSPVCGEVMLVPSLTRDIYLMAFGLWQVPFPINKSIKALGVVWGKKNRSGCKGITSNNLFRVPMS
jgi:hypothetical protein